MPKVKAKERRAMVARKANRVTRLYHRAKATQPRARKERVTVESHHVATHRVRTGALEKVAKIERELDLAFCVERMVAFEKTVLRTRKVVAAVAVASQPSDSASAVVGSMDSVRSSSGMHGCLEWLVDSGATSHILAERNLQFFEVVKEYEGVVDLKAANGEKILVSRVVELAVYMACFPGNDEHWTVSKRKFQRVVLTHVIVASIDFTLFWSRLCLGSLAAGGIESALSLWPGHIVSQVFEERRSTGAARHQILVAVIK